MHPELDRGSRPCIRVWVRHLGPASGDAPGTRPYIRGWLRALGPASGTGRGLSALHPGLARGLSALHPGLALGSRPCIRVSSIKRKIFGKYLILIQKL